MASEHGVLIGSRANGNCVLCQHKKRVYKRLSFCTAFGEGNTKAISAYVRCKHYTDPGEEGNAFIMIKGGKWR